MITFRTDMRMWWPDYDAAPARTLMYVRKHLRDMDSTINACARRRVCVQAGGHVGLWPIKLSHYFSTVLTFEPDPALFACLSKNTNRFDGIKCFDLALGEHVCRTAMRPHQKAGSWSIDRDGSVEVTMTTIDSVLVAGNYAVCDAIILDIEGYEVEALKGASETIARDRPVIHVEELKFRGQMTAEYIRSLSYVEIARHGHDVVYAYAGENNADQR